MIEFVSCEIFGDIYNQLFQIAATIEYGRRFNKRVIFPENISETTSLIEVENNPMIFDREDFEKIVFEVYDINDIFTNMNDFKGNILFKGSYKSFRNISQKTKLSLSNIICENEEKITKSYEMYANINRHFNKEDNCILIHVGSKSNFNMKYYENACKTLNNSEEKPRNVVILSDNTEWCRENFKLNGYDVSNMYFVEMKDDYAELLLMTYYKDNILSSSECSWWGSFLGLDKNKRVTCPYFEGCERIYDNTWMLIDDIDSGIL
jgi:hypothetical protein